MQGVGWLTSEELWWNDAGELMTHAPSTYKIPTCSDLATDFRVQLLENAANREDTIYRSKAVGEPPLMLAFSVFLAIRDAITTGANPAPDLLIAQSFAGGAQDDDWKTEAEVRGSVHWRAGPP